MRQVGHTAVYEAAGVGTGQTGVGLIRPRRVRRNYITNVYGEFAGFDVDFRVG